jgi:hypothetical protein
LVIKGTAILKACFERQEGEIYLFFKLFHETVGYSGHIVRKKDKEKKQKGENGRGNKRRGDNA